MDGGDLGYLHKKLQDQPCLCSPGRGEFPLYLCRKQFNLKGHDKGDLTKRVLYASWERGKAFKTSCGWIGNSITEELSIQSLEFCPTVWWPVRPVWVLHNSEVNLGLLNFKYRNKLADIVQEFRSMYRVLQMNQRKH